MPAQFYCLEEVLSFESNNATEANVRINRKEPREPLRQEHQAASEHRQKFSQRRLKEKE